MSEFRPHLASLTQNIKQGIESRLKELHTALPGIIESFDSVKQTVSVQPAIKRIFKTDDGEKEILTASDLPILINVPIIYPRGGGFSLTFPIEKGDECLLIFCERSIDLWHTFSGIKKPGARRFHSLSDAIAYVGLSSMPNKIPDYDNANVVLKKDDGSASITLKANSDIEVSSDADINVIAANNVDVQSATLTATVAATAVITCPETTVNGNVTVNGNIAATGIISAPTVAAATSLTVATKEMLTHTHTQANDSAGNTEQNTGAPI